MTHRVAGWPSPSDIMNFQDGDPDEDPWVIGVPAPEDIKVTPYSPEWPSLFQAHRQRIVETLGNDALHIEHIGSTAVPMLAAKPIIDIDLIVSDPNREDDYVPRLAALGYVLTIRERSWYQHRMLRYDLPRINLHIFGPDCPEHVRHVLFRDWLRENPNDCLRYTSAKDSARRETKDIREYNRIKRSQILAIYRKIFESRGWCLPETSGSPVA